MQRPPSGNSTALLVALRAGVFLLGLVLFTQLTEGLLKNSISYSIGEVDDVQVTTSTWPETIAVYLTFSPIFVGLMILGGSPGLFVERKSLWKALLGTAFFGYVWGSLLR